MAPTLPRPTDASAPVTQQGKQASDHCGCGDASCAAPPAPLPWRPILLMTAIGGAACLIIIKMLGT